MRSLARLINVFLSLSLFFGLVLGSLGLLGELKAARSDDSPVDPPMVTTGEASTAEGAITEVVSNPESPMESPMESPTELSPAVLESLASSKVADRDVAIQALGRDDSDLAGVLLEGLLKGRLYLDRPSGALYLGETSNLALTWPNNGPLKPANPRKVAVNNRQRETIESLLGTRSLRDPDPKVRRAVSRALIGAPLTNSSLIQEFLSQETDAETKDNLKIILALGTLKDPNQNPAAKLTAINDLSGLYAPAATDDLKALAQGSDPSLATAAAQALRRLEAKAQHLALAETIFFGLSLGSVLVLIAIGLAITFGVMGVINMAHGEMAMLGAYTVWGLQTLWPQSPGLALIMALPAAFLVSGLVGGAIEMTIIRPLYQRPLETLLATFGLSLILQQAVRKGVSSMNVAVVTPAFMSGQWRLTANLSVTQGRVLIFFFCLLVFALVYLVLRKTRLGLEIRAVTQNRGMARALGVPSRRVDTLTFALGSGVAGVSGVALSQLTNVGPNLGQDYIVDSFMVVVFGGVGNLWGTLVGGLIIGLANKFLEPINGAMLAKITIMVGVILFIQRNPLGLFPQRGRVASF